MSWLSSDNKNAKRPGESGELVGVRLQPDDLALIDAYIAGHSLRLTRPEAIRRLLRTALTKQN